METTLWMYGGKVEDGVDVGQAIKETMKLRYRLAPMIYSLYVTHYHRHGWPVLKVSGCYYSDYIILRLNIHLISLFSIWY